MNQRERNREREKDMATAFCFFYLSDLRIRYRSIGHTRFTFTVSLSIVKYVYSITQHVFMAIFIKKILFQNLLSNMLSKFNVFDYKQNSKFIAKLSPQIQ